MSKLPNICFLLIIGLSIALQVHAQESDSKGVFAFALDANGRASDNLSISDAKFSIANQVFDKLVEAKGVKNMPRPIFKMDNAEKRPAWTKPSERLVVLEEKAYDICTSLGKDSLNAIAALLAHELIHYYEKHDWKNHFIHKNQNVAAASKLTDQADDLSLELQADHLGGLLAHMAGYNTLGVMPELLDNIYASYNLLNHKDQDYPSLDERRAIAQNSDILLTKYSRIFDMSIYLTAAGQYDHAKKYLEYLMTNTNFQSREIYNNLGVLATLEAVNLMPASELKYHYPIEIELDTRLTRRSGNQDIVDLLLSEAMDLFKTSNILDASFPKAMLNMANVHALNNELDDAEYFAKKSKKLFLAEDSQKGADDAQVLLGIIAAVNGEQDKALELLDIKGHTLAEMNRCLLLSNTECSEVAIQKRQYRTKVIDNTKLEKLYARIMQDKEQALLTIELDEDNSFHTIAKQNSEILVALNNRIIGEYSLFQIISNSDVSFSRDIKIGSAKSKLETSLGQPDIIYPGTEKSIWVYEKSKAIFTLDANDIIIEWCLYNISNG